jgi:hypothetical protein
LFGGICFHLSIVARLLRPGQDALKGKGDTQRLLLLFDFSKNGPPSDFW